MATHGAPRIVVVDDTAPGADAVCAALADAGYRPQAAYSGEDALAWCERFAAHLVLLDIEMPEIDGFETARALRSREATRETVIIACTALPLERVAANSRRGEFDGYCRKGADFRLICQLVEAFARGRGRG
ncbi:response regulator [Paraburkholderia sp. CNPSo 3272]|uniref:response regulator n=1 Tax=Paraburkholderia sp. CNPSo 3272 TaxID=2940931 RepID=UPI0020B809F5|nr:response regulator [Paraburkholderia sp. CNPSo 3272]MCP3727523.1 response regulator [Paraburkholderia sp. CNPSo 3272]